MVPIRLGEICPNQTRYVLHVKRVNICVSKTCMKNYTPCYCVILDTIITAQVYIFRNILLLLPQIRIVNMILAKFKFLNLVVINLAMEIGLCVGF